MHKVAVMQQLMHIYIQHIPLVWDLCLSRYVDIDTVHAIYSTKENPNLSFSTVELSKLDNGKLWNKATYDIHSFLL